MEQHLHIEVWEYNKIWFNGYVGYESLELLSLADGSVHKTVSIYDKSDKESEGILKCVLNFKIGFEEIWDFFLQFLDWRTTNIENSFDPRKVICPKLEIKIESKKSIDPRVTSTRLKN